MKNLVEPIRNPDDIKRIIDYLKNFNIKYSVIFQLGIYSGLRVSDIVGLNISDVENKEFIEVLEQKTGKYKKFPIKEDLSKTLQNYLKIRKTQWSYDKNEPLFVGKKHCRLHKSQIYRIIVKACQDLRIDGNFGTHTMRKTFGYHHYKQFKDVALLQKIFNHSSPFITLRYIGIEQEEINDSYLSFNYDFYKVDEELREKSRKNNERTKGNFKEIQDSLEYLFGLYKKIDKKLDKITEKPNNNNENYGILAKINNYLQAGGIKHRDFCLMLLNNE